MHGPLKCAAYCHSRAGELHRSHPQALPEGHPTAAGLPGTPSAAKTKLPGVTRLLYLGAVKRERGAGWLHLAKLHKVF